LSVQIDPDNPYGESFGELDRVGLVFERQHGDDGSEDLLGDRTIGSLRG